VGLHAREIKLLSKRDFRRRMATTTGESQIKMEGPSLTGLGKRAGAPQKKRKTGGQRNFFEGCGQFIQSARGEL